METLNATDEREKMPRLNQGSHPAQVIVFRYRQEAIEQILAVHQMISKPAMGGLTDAEFNRYALAGEIMAQRIRKYLQVNQAGRGVCADCGQH
jgi:hypothetical protein